MQVATRALVVLIDVDHTLLDGGLVRDAITSVVSRSCGLHAVERFWELYEQVRAELERVDVPLTAFRLEHELGMAEGATMAEMARADFAACLHPGALEALSHLGELGVTVVLSDGDPVFQRAKIEGAGIASAVGDRVIITTRKERELDEVQRRFPAAHYAMLDDRVGILAAVKAQLDEGVTTILVRQGRYANELDAARSAGEVIPDLVVHSIREVLGLSRGVLLGERS